MRKFLILVGMLALFSSPIPAGAQPGDYYGRNAERVANNIGCRSYTAEANAPGIISQGKCRIAGRKVSVVTFRGPRQQARYRSELVLIAQDFLPDGRHYFAVAPGVIVYNQSLTRRPAEVAARRLTGGRLVETR